ncbi:MAG: hypothetical protein II992_03255 [Lachnospiraceae bacterium]|nr:hypothetical protein [Lachnospiraceae bacterium]
MMENMTTSQALLSRYQLLTEIGEQFYEKYRNGQLQPLEEEIKKMNEIAKLDVFLGKENGSYEKKLTHCPQCQELIPENGAFCFKCGCAFHEYQKQHATYCVHCGATIYQQNYCDVCGAKIEA